MIKNLQNCAIMEKFQLVKDLSYHRSQNSNSGLLLELEVNCCQYEFESLKSLKTDHPAQFCSNCNLISPLSRIS